MSDREFDKIFIRIYVLFGELLWFVLSIIITALIGGFFYVLRKYLYSIFRILGVTYFSDRHKLIREINSDLLWCMGALRADVYGLFRTYNGKSYVEENNFSTLDTDSKKVYTYNKIITKRVNDKPNGFFPEYLDVSLYSSIICKIINNDWYIFKYEEIKSDSPQSQLLVFMESNGIDTLMAYRIWDIDKKTYGLIFFCWGINKEPIFDRHVSKKLDSISIRFQNYVSSSIMEKIGVRLI